MKKLIFFLTSLSFIFIINSCYKEDKVQRKEEVITTNMVEFQEYIIYGISLLKENESLLIWEKEGKYDWDVLENRNSYNQVSLRTHDCHDKSALRFAKCVKELIDDGKCVTVGYSDEEYWGDVVDCPEE